MKQWPTTVAILAYHVLRHARTHTHTDAGMHMGAPWMNSWKFHSCSEQVWLLSPHTMNGGKKRKSPIFCVIDGNIDFFPWTDVTSLTQCLSFRDLLHVLEKCNTDPVAIAECFVSKVTTSNDVDKDYSCENTAQTPVSQIQLQLN